MGRSKFPGKLNTLSMKRVSVLQSQQLNVVTSANSPSSSLSPSSNSSLSPAGSTTSGTAAASDDKGLINGDNNSRKVVANEVNFGNDFVIKSEKVSVDKSDDEQSAAKGIKCDANGLLNCDKVAIDKIKSGRQKNNGESSQQQQQQSSSQESVTTTAKKSAKVLLSSSLSTTSNSSSSGDSTRSSPINSSCNTSREEEISEDLQNDKKEKVIEENECKEEELKSSGVSTRARSVPAAPPASITTMNSSGPVTKGEKNEATKKVKKKTVTFKNVLETSDDVVERKVYNPDLMQIPLVPIIKKERSLVRSESIVKPSRLTEILKQNYNNLNKVKTMSFGSQETDTKASEEGDDVEEEEDGEERADGGDDTDEEVQSKGGSSGNVAMGDKRFILPKRSLHSRRVIKPNKKFLDDMDGCSAKAIKRVNSGNRNNNIKLAVKGAAEDDVQSSQTAAESEPKSKTKSISFQEGVSNSGGGGAKNKAGDETKETATGTSSNTSVDTTGDGLKIPCSNLFGQPINTSGNELNLTPFGSNKVILRQPRLQFAIPHTSFTKTFGFGSAESIKAGGSISNMASCQENSSIINSALNSNSASSVNCGICSTKIAITYFTQSSRKFGVNSCEACRKFISKMIKRHAIVPTGSISSTPMQCQKTDGNCVIPQMVQKNSTSGSNTNGVNSSNSHAVKLLKATFKERCHACWLKKCIKTYQLSSNIRTRLIASLPVSMREIETSNLAAQSSTGAATISSISSAVSPNSQQLSPFSIMRDNSDPSNSNIFSKGAATASSISPGGFGKSNGVLAWTAAENKEKEIKSENSSPFASPLPIAETEKVTKVNKNKKSPDHSSSALSPNNVKEVEPIVSPQEKVAAANLSPTAANDPLKRQKVDLKGPRVKHVCRSASIVLGQPLATFPENEDASPRPESPSNGQLLEPVENDIDKKPCITCTDENEEPQLAINQQKKITVSNDKKVETDSIVPELKTTISVKAIKGESQKLPRKVGRPPSSHNLTNLSSKVNNTTSLKRSHQQAKPPVPIQQTPMISIDFWENYDPVEITQTGFGLIVTESIPLRSVCFLCGSCGSPDSLMYCVCCCEPYHQYCIEDEYNVKASSALLDETFNVSIVPQDSTLSHLNWLCPRCTVCYTCNMASGSKVKCQKCQKNYHSTCLGTSKRLLGADRPLICTNCLKCKSCGTTTVTKFVGNLPMCTPCFKLRQKGNFCPLCQKCYEENDFDLKMMECGECKKWVHSKCEGLTDEQYNMLSVLPENIEFFCRKCFKRNSSLSDMWRDAVAAEFKAGLLSVVKLLSKSRSACALLRLSPRKKTSMCACQPILSSKSIQFKKADAFEENSTAAEDVPEETQCYCALNQKYSYGTKTQSLLDVKRKIFSDEYVSLQEFNYEVLKIINAVACEDLLVTYKEILSEAFPWFQNETKACTDALEEDMYCSGEDNAMDRIESLVGMGANEEQQVPNTLDLPEDINEYFYSAYEKPDSRMCQFCKKMGEDASTNEHEEGRLLYSGQNTWVHTNCALWSAEVFEEIDGSLQNIHSAVSRGRMIKCSECGNKGATVGCNLRNCGEHYHYPCAKKVNCAFMADKTVYCPRHLGESEKKKCPSERDFDVLRPVYVELDRRRKKPVEANKIQFMIGSLRVKSLGKLHPLFSDTVEAIIPVDFMCTRLYWSVKEPWKIVEYSVRTMVQMPGCNRNGNISMDDLNRHFTVDHSLGSHFTQFGLGQIAKWHSNLLNTNQDEEGITNQNEEHTNGLQTEEEPQNNSDLLPPEIKEAIFEDLPHDILDGISMLDIFPKLMNYEDLIAIDTNKEIYNELYKDSKDNMSDDDGSSQLSMDGFTPASTLGHVEDALLSATRPLSSSLTRELKRSKSEVLSRGSTVGGSRSQQRSSSFTWNSKLDSNSAKRRKVSMLQELGLSESVLRSLGNRQESKISVGTSDRNKSFPIDELKTNRNSISWTATKKFLQMSSDLVTDSRDSSSNMADRFKISQLDGMDDISSDGSGSPGMDFDAIGQRQVKQLVIYSNKGAESPVKCDRCHCAYRTNESYQRHLATCEPMSSTGESESETTSRTPDNETTTANSNVVTVTVSEMCTSSAMPVITPQQLMPTFNGQILNANNLSGLQTIPSNIIPLQNAGSVQTIPLNGLNQLNGMQNVLMAQNSTAQPFIQPLNTGTNFQQATTSLFPTIQNLNDLSSANFLPKAAQRILSPNSSQMPIQLATNTLNLQNFNQNTSTANFTTSQSNQIISLGSSAAAAAAGQNIISIPQVSNITTTTTTVKSSNNTINIQAPPKSHIILPQPQQGDYKQLKKVNRVSNSIVATNRAKVKLGPQQIQSPIKKIQKSPEGTRPIQMMSSNLPMIRPQLSGTTTTVSTQQNAQTAQISATPISSAPMATLGQNLIFQPQQTPQPILVQQLPNGILQYVSTPMDTTNNGMQYISMPSAQPNPILNSGGFQLQTDASGNLILANTGGLQVLSQPQTQIQPQVIGTIIQNPATTIQCGMMATEQMVMGGTPALEMVQDPTTGCMYLTSQPVYYGLETIVQNTVMQSQQFVSTAMQGVLSQNSICQATTTQVFQASKIEPIMEVPGGYVVLNNVSDLQQKANTNTATSILPVSSAGPVLNSVQNITFPQQTQQTIQNQLIQQQSAHHSTPSLRALSSPPPVQPPIVKPTVKTSPMVVSKIQPQVTSTSNIKLETIKSPQPQQLHQVQITPVNKPQTVILPKPDSSTWISQPHHSENISQVHSNASTNMISISNCNNNNLSNNSITSQSLMVQPVQQQQHHHQQQQQRGLTATPIKPATIVVKSIKPKGITKPVTITKLQQQTKPVFLNDSGNVNQQRINNHVNQAIENSITIEQIGDQNYQINLVNNTKPLVSQQSGYGVKVNQQSYDNQQMDVEGTKVRHYQNQTSQSQPLMSNNNYGQYSNSQQATIVTTTTSTPQIQLPSAPYTSNIPTNIVNPIPQNNSNGHHSNTRPMNRVLPMQTIHARQSPPTPPEPKILLQEEEAIQPVSPQHEEITDRLPVEQTGNCRRVQFGLLENSNMEFRSLNTQKVDSSEMKKKINEILDCLDKDVEMESEKEKEENEQRELLKIQEETEKEAEIQKENQIPVDNADPIIEFKKPKLTNVLQTSNQNSENQPIVSTGPKLLFEIQSQDGFTFRSTSINELWSKVFDGVQQSRKSHGLSGLPEGPLADMAGYQMLGLKTNAMRYLLEQMPGLEKYKNYSPKYHPNGPKENLQPFSQANNTIPFCYSNDMFEEIKENTFGSARCEPYAGRSEYDMFSWLASRHRKQPIPVVVQSENELTIPRRGTAGSNLPMAMRYRTLKETAKESVGVFRSHIHGRGLFCIRDIEAGEMVIEYAGELIRATLTDKREKYYEGKGIGCYMFRIDDNFVVDATMRGNAARFINHSCEPNCYSKVVDILGHKHIIIFALRRIVPGEELTYDYKFPFEDVKIPCSCGSKRCRKYLN